MSSATTLARYNLLCLKQPLPLFLEKVRAGFPSPAEDYVDQALDLNELCIKHPAATFFVRVDGDSMLDAGIFSGDILVVDRALEASHGDIVIAAVNGDFTVKMLELNPVRLIAKNAAYPTICFDEGEELQIFGVVTSVVRQIQKSH